MLFMIIQSFDSVVSFTQRFNSFTFKLFFGLKPFLCSQSWHPPPAKSRLWRSWAFLFRSLFGRGKLFFLFYIILCQPDFAHLVVKDVACERRRISSGKKLQQEKRLRSQAIKDAMSLQCTQNFDTRMRFCIQRVQPRRTPF